VESSDPTSSTWRAGASGCCSSSSTHSCSCSIAPALRAWPINSRHRRANCLDDSEFIRPPPSLGGDVPPASPASRTATAAQGSKLRPIRPQRFPIQPRIVASEPNSGRSQGREVRPRILNSPGTNAPERWLDKNKTARGSLHGLAPLTTKLRAHCDLDHRQSSLGRLCRAARNPAPNVC
jgi:hypothetical protein